MFSSRFNYELSDNPLNILLNRKKSNGDKIIDLTISNPTLAGFKYEEEVIISAISQPASLTYKPSPNGLIEARDAICHYYKDSKSDINADSIFLTSGTSEAYSFIFKLLCNPGDEILIPKPSYPLIDFIAGLENIDVFKYPLVYDGCWKIDLLRLKSMVSKKVKAIIIINPNNPTGSYLNRDELDKINGICIDNDIAIISDEVFLDYKFSENVKPFSLTGNKKVLTFVLSGLSKICALPQLKLSWIQINAPDDIFSKVIERMEIITDTFLSVGTPVQNAAAKLISSRRYIQNQILTRININLKFLKNEIKKSNNSILLVPKGGWYAILKFNDNIPDEERCLKLLQEHNIYIHPGYFYDFEKDGLKNLKWV